MPFRKVILLPLFFMFMIMGSCTLVRDLMRKNSSSDLTTDYAWSAEWTNLNPSIFPPSRDFHSMCHDSSNRVVILYGGKTNADSYPNFYYLHDTWAYIISQNTWSNMNPAVSPAPRHRHAACYDSYNRKVILFGGDGGDWYSNDTWAYDYASNTWSNMNPVGPPPGRYYHSICYDSYNHKIILFGGGGGGQFDDTWAYDYASNSWSNMNPAVHPSARYLHSLCYDRLNRKVILFGGRDNSVWYSETWSYDYALNTWVPMSPATNPSARSDFSMCYDSTNNITVLFGGWDQSTGLNDTWVYNFALNQWRDITPALSPAGRSDYAVCFDSVNGRIILYGGWTNNNANFGYSGDTWALTIK